MTDSKKTGKTFSVTEVGTLIESLRSEFRAVTEGVTALRKDVDELKSRVSALEVEVRLLKDVVRVAIPSINVRLSNLEAKVGV
jgi:polyhydroxyalkanoate synthesis regulator phasin